jgi:hypothetical protein
MQCVCCNCLRYIRALIVFRSRYSNPPYGPVLFVLGRLTRDVSLVYVIVYDSTLRGPHCRRLHETKNTKVRSYDPSSLSLFLCCSRSGNNLAPFPTIMNHIKYSTLWPRRVITTSSHPNLPAFDLFSKQFHN